MADLHAPADIWADRADKDRLKVGGYRRKYADSHAMWRNAALYAGLRALALKGAERFCARAKGCDMDEVYRMHRRARDRSWIKAGDPLEVRYWATSLRCSKSELRAAIAVVGAGAEVVRDYLELAGVRVV